MTDKEPLKITIEDIDGEYKAETPSRDGNKVKEGAAEVGHKLGGAVKDSAARVAHKIADTTTDVTSRSAEAMRDKVGETIQAQSKATADAVEARLRELDWKNEAQKGAQGGLRWLSQRLDDLAEKLRTDEKSDEKVPADEKNGEK